MNRISANYDVQNGYRIGGGIGTIQTNGAKMCKTIFSNKILAAQSDVLMPYLGYHEESCKIYSKKLTFS